MSPQTIRILIAGALLVHGVGHTLGIWKPSSNVMGVRVVAGALWVVIALGFIVSSMSFYGLIFPAGWWRPVATVFAVISLAALLIFGRSWPAFNFIGAFGLNIAILAALLWLHWPPVEMFNR
jgi:hypothetical protein